MSELEVYKKRDVPAGEAITGTLGIDLHNETVTPRTKESRPVSEFQTYILAGGHLYTISDAAPTAPVEGQLWSDTGSDDTLKRWSGTEWAQISGGVGGTTTTIKQPSLVGGPENVNISSPDRFYDTGIDMPASADIADDDTFTFSLQFRSVNAPRSEPIIVPGAVWKALPALTTAEQSQLSFTTASTYKTITAFLRRTNPSGGQAQQNSYVAKGADGVSLYVGDNHNSFDATVQVWMNADSSITGLKGEKGDEGGTTVDNTLTAIGSGSISSANDSIPILDNGVLKRVVVSNFTTFLQGQLGIQVEQITQAAYNALGTPDSNTLYAIVG